MIYQKSPYILLVYPQTLQVYDTQHWQGWVRQPAGSGTVNNYWNYLDVAPRETAAVSSGTGWRTPVVAGILVVVAAAGIWWALRRRRAPTAEETP